MIDELALIKAQDHHNHVLTYTKSLKVATKEKHLTPRGLAPTITQLQQNFPLSTDDRRELPLRLRCDHLVRTSLLKARMACRASKQVEILANDPPRRAS